MAKQGKDKAEAEEEEQMYSVAFFSDDSSEEMFRAARALLRTAAMVLVDAPVLRSILPTLDVAISVQTYVSKGTAKDRLMKQAVRVVAERIQPLSKQISSMVEPLHRVLSDADSKVIIASSEVDIAALSASAAEMEQATESYGDSMLARQVRFMSRRSKLAVAMCKLQLVWSTAEANREQKPPAINDWVPYISDLRIAHRESSLFSDELKLSAHVASLFHITELGFDSWVDALPSECLATALEDVEKLLTKTSAFWAKYAQSQIDIVNTSCPDGWQAVEDKLLVDPAVGRMLLKNKRFPEIGPAVDILRPIASAVKKITGDTCGPFFQAFTLKALDAAINLGGRTVVATYALFQILVALPKSEDIAKAAKDLTKELKDKAIPVPEVIKVRLQELEAGGKAEAAAKAEAEEDQAAPKAAPKAEVE